jgi:hypothetical protein
MAGFTGRESMLLIISVVTAAGWLLALLAGLAGPAGRARRAAGHPAG